MVISRVRSYRIVETLDAAKPHRFPESRRILLLANRQASRSRGVGCRGLWFGSGIGQGSPSQRYRAAVTMISTLYLGAASLTSTVARAGVFPGATQASHAPFISAKVFMSVR